MSVRSGRQNPLAILCFISLCAACGSSTAPGGNDADAGGPSFKASDGGNTGPVKDGGTTTTNPDSGTTTPTCVKTTCTAAGANCGPIGDGCGGSLTCGTCSGSDTCGGGGMPSQCGTGVSCTARTCQEAGANCGPVADGCGNMIMCGTCDNGGTCGGDGTPSVCSGTSATCTGLCLQQVQCPAGTATTITGTVHSPTPSTFGTADPLYGAIVYIPNGPVAAFVPGVACETCGAAVSGAPLVTTSSGPDGTYTLTNAPVGSNIPLVVQIGRWRRQVQIPSVAPCVANPIPDDLDRLPRTHLEGDIPAMAMVTGGADPFECVLRKIGIADSEFTDPGGGGRVSMYVNNGFKLDSNTPSMNSLTSSPTELANYDMVILACAGSQIDQTSTDQMNVINYANLGGRVFATHYSYVWFDDPKISPTGATQPWKATADWAPSANDNGGANSVNATVDQTFTQGMAFANWLQTVGASTTLGSITVTQVKDDFSGVIAPSQRWLYDTAASNRPLHYTFDTPVGVSTGAQCGRALFSDFHVSSTGGGGCTNSSQCGTGGTCIAGFCIGGSSGSGLAGECDSTPMDAQEKALEFMMFDLASCIPNGGFVIGSGGGPQH